MVQRLKLAVDAMGGDDGPKVVIPAVTRFLDSNPEIEVVLYGLEDQLLEHFPNRDPDDIDRCRVQYSSQVVSDQESPSSALRYKQDSSMWLALQAVAQGSADACISAGNTGALMAMGLKLLGTHTDVERPAICTVMPKTDGRCYLLDVGANVDCTAEQLQQFALMATALVGALEGTARPPCSLLNIGKEAIKGNRVVKAAAELFDANAALNYAGFIEADELLQGSTRIVVCDGFTGNIALKAIEGSVRMLLRQLALVAGRLPQKVDSEENKEPGTKGADYASEIDQTFDPRQYNGAVLLGLNGVVIKSHGNADEKSYRGALQRAAEASKLDVSELVAAYLKKYMLGV